MRKNLLWLVFVLATAAQAALPDADAPRPPELKPVPQQAEAAHLAARLLTRFHYRAVPLDDAMSEKIFDQYLKTLDPEKLFFVQADIDQLAGSRAKLDDAINAEDLAAPFAMFNLSTQRAYERLAYARSLLKAKFDFQLRESFQDARDKAAWPSSEAEMRELWRKRVKNDWLRLRLAGKNDQYIMETLDRRYELSQKRLARIKSEDVFQIFMNSYTMAVDPHTNYMGPRAAEDFDISMRLSLVGIGAVLAKKDEYTTIRELVPGGPASLSGQLKSGDRIVGIAQGESGAMTDVQDWRIDDTVALLRGAADSVVRLDVLPADAGVDGQHRRVSLVRKKITLQEQSARSSVVQVTDGAATRRIGVIIVPTFYEDFEARQRGERDYKSATRDVARLLGELKKDKVDSVLIDLRNNGGGSLTEAIELTGLFIDQGPVVQQRNAKGEISVGRDRDGGVAWDGPLGILINRGSASASEILAAAIQDYGRGLVFGEPSFGKGSVQAMVDLDQVAENDQKRFGELKFTTAQFFRINGGTTQLRGVTPDILFPATADVESFGESTYDNALPWNQVKALDYSPAGDLKDLLRNLSSLHDERVKKDKDFQYLQEDLAYYELQRKKNLVSLNEDERRQERDARETRLKAREALKDAGKRALEIVRGGGLAAARNTAVRDDGLQAEERNLASELAEEDARKNARDVLLDEAVRILSDGVGLLRTGARLADDGRRAQL